MKSVYILKTRGTDKIPDYVQLRDENFVLLSHSRADKADAILETAGIHFSSERFERIIKNIPYGEIQQIELE